MDKERLTRFYKGLSVLTAVCGIVYLVSIIYVLIFLEMPDRANFDDRLWRGLLSQTVFSFAVIIVSSLFIIYCGFYCHKNVLKTEKYAAMTGFCILSAALCIIARMVYGFVIQIPSIILLNFSGDTTGIIPWTTIPTSTAAVLNIVYYTAGFILPIAALWFMFRLRKNAAKKA